MKIQSLIKENENLIPVEVEITLLPGLPQIQFLGLPDQIIKESVHRIKSALKLQGFDLPKAQQILVNLKPHYLKKSSRGLELAVAAGILWKTAQLPPPKNLAGLTVYGELSLEGEVSEPEDLTLSFENDAACVLTGRSAVDKTFFAREVTTNLRGLSTPERRPASQEVFQARRPEKFLNFLFSAPQARLLEVVALGEHSLILAGPAGSGKTTMAKALGNFLRAPGSLELREIKKYSRSTENWRPVVQPHHSSTPLSLIGGGVPPARGEFARAHLGLLILDEFLEFPSKAQEALREPMEEGLIRLSRSSKVSEFAARSQVVACTNLCPCGDWVPRHRVRCSRSLQKCRAYVNRLSGPVADRFQILFFSEKYRGEGKISGHQILARIEQARSFQRGRRAANAALSRAELLLQADPFAIAHLLPKEFSSRRRELATLRVARSLADLEGSPRILKQHLEEALNYSWRSFEQLKALD